MRKPIEIRVPDIGGSSNVGVAEVYVKAGDKIKVDDNLIMLETDKATMEVPATMAGEVKEVKVKVGDTISEGDLILLLEDTNTISEESKLTKPADTPLATTESQPISDKSVADMPQKLADKSLSQILVNSAKTTTTFDEAGFRSAFASPSIRKLAREMGVDLANVAGSGTKNRITEADVKSYIKSVMSGQNSVQSNGSNLGLNLLPWPSVDFAKFGEIESKPLSRIKKLSGANLARNWAMIPHVTQFDEADITELESFRQQLNEEYKTTGIKVTPLAFLIKACVYALKKFPELNASLDGDNLVYKNYYHIGFAADTPQGLVVPVLKDADKKGVVALAKESAELAKLARDGKLKPIDMQGGTFTISSLGGIGGTAFTPIINAPEVAILGVSKSSIKPVWNGKDFAPKLMLPLSLSYDHRIIDGALAAKFTNYLSIILSDIKRLVL